MFFKKLKHNQVSATTEKSLLSCAKSQTQMLKYLKQFYLSKRNVGATGIHVTCHTRIMKDDGLEKGFFRRKGFLVFLPCCFCLKHDK